MNCPYCNKEMEQGIIRSPQEISWQKEKHFFNRADMHEGAVCLSEFSFLKGSSVEAWLCRDCGKVVIDLEERNNEIPYKEIEE